MSTWLPVGYCATTLNLIREALLGCGGTEDPAAPLCWRLPLAPGVTATARVEDSWLLFDADVASCSVLGAAHNEGGAPWTARHFSWNLLCLNATLPGGCKLALRIGDAAVRLRAEVPLDPDDNMRARISRACAAYAAAVDLLCGASPARDEAADGSGGHAPETTVPDQASELRALCEEADWPFAERPDGSMTIDLDVPREFRQARLRLAACDAHAPRQVQLSVPLAGENESASDVCRRAVALLLLRVAAAVRLARPAADESGATRLEVTCPATAFELQHALAALSVACRLCAAEADVLSHDESIARAYLAAAEEEDSQLLSSRECR